jgi:hypothetical protein
MFEPVLLGEVLVMVEFEVDPAGTQFGDADPECAHHRLGVEARSDPFGVVGIGWGELGSHAPILHHQRRDPPHDVHRMIGPLPAT